jgi:hypothetical protein
MTITTALSAPTISSNSLTALEIVQEAAAEIGLPVPSSLLDTDALTVQMRVLLNSCGRDLREAFPWNALTRIHTFDTVIGQEEYALPTDYGYLPVESQWNKDAAWPLLGPKPTREWMALSVSAQAFTQQRFALYGNAFKVAPLPTAEETIGIAYISACWVAVDADTVADRVEADTDRPLLDAMLLKKLLKIKLLGSKGLDTTLAVQEFTLYYGVLTDREKSDSPVVLDGIDEIVLESLVTSVLPENGLSALRIAQEAAAELELPLPLTLVDYANPISQRMYLLLNSCGRELAETYPWQQLTRRWVLTTDGINTEFDLPEDWGYAIDQSQWDATNHWPMLGPKSAQEWAYFKNGIVFAGPRLRYRIVDNRLHLHPQPGAGRNIAIEYVSACWVARDDPNAPLRINVIQYDVDRPIINSLLLKKYLKLKLATGKRITTDAGIPMSPYDTQALLADFRSYFEKVCGKDTGAAKLSMSGEPASLFIGIGNVPDGNWQV